MKTYPRYDVTRSKELDTIEFISTGIKGNIDKIIRFESTDNPLIYNLAFGDKIIINRNNEMIQDFDDKVNSENGDRDMVLATVASAADEYTLKYPERWLIFSGSDVTRTRLYRMAITKNYAELSIDFHIFGIFDTDIGFIKVPFDSNIKFDGFIIKRK